MGRGRYAVRVWRGNRDDWGLAGLEGRTGSERHGIVDRRRITAGRSLPPPRKYGVTHWSSRLLATHLKTSSSTVAKAWREVGVAPWRGEAVKISTPPQPGPKVTSTIRPSPPPPRDPNMPCHPDNTSIQ